MKSLNEILKSKQSEVDNLKKRLEAEDSVNKQQN